jgi:hypothetical protein
VSIAFKIPFTAGFKDIQPCLNLGYLRYFLN